MGMLRVLLFAILWSTVVADSVSEPTLECIFCDASCALNTASINCRCDIDCVIYRDCCPIRPLNCEAQEDQNSYPPFQCHNVRVSVNASSSRAYWMVSECSEAWLNSNSEQAIVEEVQNGCALQQNGLPPVSDAVTGFVYRNEYCATCNRVENVIPWRYNLICQPELRALVQNSSGFVVTQDILSRFCTVGSFNPPVLEETMGLPPPRECFESVNTCLDINTLDNRTGIEWNVTLYQELTQQCTGGTLQNLVVEGFNDDIIYRNQACARCNGVSLVECFFESPAFEVPGPDQPFSVFLDILGSGQVVTSSEVVAGTVPVTCLETEVFDPFMMMCRETIQQSLRNMMSIAPVDIICNGSLINLTTADFFRYLDQNTVVYNDEVFLVQFNTSAGNPVICVNFSQNGTQEVNTTVLFYSYPQAYFILTYIGCSLSVIGSMLVILTYTIFTELRTLPSKLVMNLAVAILIGNLLLLLGGPVVNAFPDVIEMCSVVGILLHFFFLSQFSWMSIVLSETARIFFRVERLKMEESKKRKRTLLLLYLFVGWTTPLLITVITIIVNYTRDGLVLYGVLPDGSRGSCWINHLESVVVAFVTPLAVSLIFNTITFTIVSVLLFKASRTQAKLEKDHMHISKYLRIVSAVFSVSGVAWIFGFLAILAGTSWAWYPFITLNSTQGFIIFLAFLCTKRVAKLYLNMFTCNKTRPSKSATTRYKVTSTMSSKCSTSA